MSRSEDGTLAFGQVFESQTDSQLLTRIDESNFAINDEHVSPQLSFGRFPSIAQLAENDPNQQEGSYREQAREYGKWIINRLMNKPRYVVVISAFFGILCGACGIALFLIKNAGRLLSSIGIAMVGLGIFTPLVPWWLLILLLAVAK